MLREGCCGRVKGEMKWRTACGTAFLWLVLGEKPKEGGSGQHCEGLGLGFFFIFKIALLFVCVLKAMIYRQNCC